MKRANIVRYESEGSYKPGTASKECTSLAYNGSWELIVSQHRQLKSLSRVDQVDKNSDISIYDRRVECSRMFDVQVVDW